MQTGFSDVFVVRSDGVGEPVDQVYCKHEEEELELLLWKSPEILPGAQIDPEVPRRWLVVSRQMPVPDPGTAKDKMSLDILLADQDAIPTLVECKRFADTRSRREVVGQMLDYAANGHYYWDKQQLIELASKTAEDRDKKPLSTLVAELKAAGGDTVDTYFEQMQQNLRDGRLRLIFFTEESRPELRSIVDFLNRQMERTEVLLVEARQYDVGEKRVVIPRLFGYSEEARRAKRSGEQTSGRLFGTWTLGDFSLALARSVPGHAPGVDRFLQLCGESAIHVNLGTGKKPSIIIKSRVCPRAALVIDAQARLSFNFGYMYGSAAEHRLRDALADFCRNVLHVQLPDNYASKYPGFPAEQWLPHSEDLARLLVRFEST